MPTWMTSHGARDKAASGGPAHFHSVLYQMGMSGANEAGSLILAFCHIGITISNRTGDAFPDFWKPLPSHPEGCGEWGTVVTVKRHPHLAGVSVMALVTKTDHTQSCL